MMSTQDVVIIGGGLAGLCAANRLIDLGCSCTLIEAGHYPTHKVCGEFLSPECLSLLAQWDIQQIAPISRVCFWSGWSSYRFTFSRLAGGLSHLQLDPQLAQRAIQRGVDLRTGISVHALELPDASTPLYRISLSSGERLHAQQIICATGRVPGLATITSPQMPYVGFKAHFMNVQMDDCLEMYAFANGYLGLSPIEEGKVNCACLIRAHEQMDTTIHDIMKKNPAIATRLSHAQIVTPDWIKCAIPEFGIKPTPHWPQAYFIGDAAGTIPPACGDGLAMAITSGYLVGDYVMQRQDVAFRKAWHDHYARRIQIGKWFHKILMNPLLTQCTIYSSKLLPFVPNLLFRFTRS